MAVFTFPTASNYFIFKKGEIKLIQYYFSFFKKKNSVCLYSKASNSKLFWTHNYWIQNFCFWIQFSDQKYCIQNINLIQSFWIQDFKYSGKYWFVVTPLQNKHTTKHKGIITKMKNKHDDDHELLSMLAHHLEESKLVSFKSVYLIWCSYLLRRPKHFQSPDFLILSLIFKSRNDPYDDK